MPDPPVTAEPGLVTAVDWPLFVSALLSATLLPGSSEALLLLRLAQGADLWTTVAVASAGNLLGSANTYGLGRVGSTALHRRWLRIDAAQLARAERWFQRYGCPSLLLAWLPVIGDPLCLVAGLLRCHLGWFLALTGVGKLGRYTLLAWLAGG